MREREFWTRKRPDGTKGDVLWTNLGGRRVSTGQKTAALARRWKQARLLERADPRRAASETATLADAVREMYAELRRRGRSEGTQERCRQKLAHFVRLWGEDCRLSEIDARLVSRYLDTRLADSIEKTGFATPARITLRDELAFLRQTLKLARKQGRYPHHPDDVLPDQFETAHKPRADFVEEDKLPALLAKLAPKRAAHVLFFVVTAGRLSDSYRARREDFDTVEWTIRVRGSKTIGSDRVIPVPEFLRPWVERLLALAPRRDPLFAEWHSIHRDLKVACKRAGVPPVSTNGLRRTFGKMFRLRGHSLDTISRMFGHTTAKLVRDVYADVQGKELAELLALESGRAAKSPARD